MKRRDLLKTSAVTLASTFLPSISFVKESETEEAEQESIPYYDVGQRRVAYIDHKHGCDETGDGSKERPYQTCNHLWEMAGGVSVLCGWEINLKRYPDDEKSIDEHRRP